MRSRDDLSEGMFVVTADRHELGRVVRFDAMSFLVEKGSVVPRALRVPYEDVDSVVGMRVLLTRRRGDYVRAEEREPSATADELDAADRGELAPEELSGATHKT
jgi:hypothetical protein